MDTERLDPRRIYLLACESGRWVAEPIPTDGPGIQASIRAAEYMRQGNSAAALEALRYADE